MALKRLFMGLALVLFLAALVLLPGLIRGGPLYAQSGGGFNLSWNTIDGGGGTFSTGGGYRLGGTIGQSDAGQVSGGGYSLNGGFWQTDIVPPPPEMDNLLYLPAVLK